MGDLIRFQSRDSSSAVPAHMGSGLVLFRRAGASHHLTLAPPSWFADCADCRYEEGCTVKVGEACPADSPRAKRISEARKAFRRSRKR